MAAKKKATTRRASTGDTRRSNAPPPKQEPGSTNDASSRPQQFADYDDRRGSRGLNAQPEQQHDARDQRDDQSNGRSDKPPAMSDGGSGDGSRIVRRDPEVESRSGGARGSTQNNGKAGSAKASPPKASKGRAGAKTSTPESKKMRISRSTA